MDFHAFSNLFLLFWCMFCYHQIHFRRLDFSFDVSFLGFGQHVNEFSRVHMFLGLLTGVIWSLPSSCSFVLGCLGLVLYSVRNLKHWRGLSAVFIQRKRLPPSAWRTSMCRQQVQFHCGMGLGGYLTSLFVAPLDFHMVAISVLCIVSLWIGIVPLFLGPVSSEDWHFIRSPLREISTDRVWIIGHCGSGKSTTAEQLALRLGADWIDLDDIAWTPGWKMRSTEDFKHALGKRLDSPRWVVSGNYLTPVGRDVLAPLATCVIWLRLPLPVTFTRILYRSLVTRLWEGNTCCNGNYEDLRTLFSCSKDSMFYYSLFYAGETDRKLKRFVLSELPKSTPLVVFTSTKRVINFVNEV